jgi:hypothetical protein
MNLHQTVTISDQVISQEVSGETVLLDLNRESYFGLDEVGTRVWQLINEDGHLPAILATMLQEFEVEELTLKNDIADLLAKLEAQGLVTLTNEQNN